MKNGVVFAGYQGTESAMKRDANAMRPEHCPAGLPAAAQAGFSPMYTYPPEVRDDGLGCEGYAVVNLLCGCPY